MSLSKTARFVLTVSALLSLMPEARSAGGGLSAKCEAGTTVLSRLAAALIEEQYPFPYLKTVSPRVWDPLRSGLSGKKGRTLSELGCIPARNYVEPKSNICTISVKCSLNTGFQRNHPALYAIVIEKKGDDVRPIGMVVYKGGEGCGLIYSGQRLLVIEGMSCRK